MDKCMNIVSSGWLGIIKTQCKRKATKDGYCWQHHPEAVKQREMVAAKKLDAKPLYLFRKVRFNN